MVSRAVNENIGNKNFKVESSILVFAMRYAMGRQTFAPKIVADNIIANLTLFSCEELELIIRDIDEYDKQFSFGMEYDREMWLILRFHLEDFLNNAFYKM